jgi:tetratricopeptide (TPR) repeat protein
LRKSVRIFDVTADSHLPAGLSALGAAALQEGKFALAKNYLARALEISRQRSEGDHLTISLAQAGLAEAYLGERNYPQAAALIRQAISAERASREESHYPMAKLLLTAANIETYQHRWPQAEAYYREALEIYRKVLRPDHPDLMKAKRQYAQFSKSFRK